MSLDIRSKGRIICKVIQLILRLNRFTSILPKTTQIARFLSKVATFFFENNSVQCRSSSRFIDRYSFRHNSLSRNPDYGQRVFRFDRFTWWPPGPGSLKITYFPRLSWSSLEFPRIEETFSSSHSTLPLDPLHPLKTERNGEWPFSGQVSKLRYRV